MIKNTVQADEKKKKEAARKRFANFQDSPAKKQKTSSRPAPALPFNQIMRGMTIALSGFVNPERSNIRQAVLDMGGQYERDVTGRVTHLICSVAGTPKYNQFLGRGKIMKKEWVFAQSSQRTKLPWKEFSLAPVNSSDEDESETEEPQVESDPGWTSGSDTSEQVVETIPDSEEELEDVRILKTQLREAQKKAPTEGSSDYQIVSYLFLVICELMTKMGKWVKTMENNEDSSLQDFELDPKIKEKELLFAPYIFIVNEKLKNRKKIATAIRERGGKVKVLVITLKGS